MKTTSYYETVFILRPEVPLSQREQLVEMLLGVARQQGGQLVKQEYWGLQALAYPIRKHQKGHYFLMQIEAPPTAIAEFERVIRLQEEVIRFQTIRIEQPDPQPSSFMQRASGTAQPASGRPDGSQPNGNPASLPPPG